VSRPAVLYVDGDGEHGAAVAGELALDGFAVALARSSEHARVLASRDPRSVVVIARLNSPAEQISLLALLRSGGGEHRLWDPCRPVLVIGGGGEPAMLRALDSGADDYIAAPVSYLELRARIRSLIRRSTRRSAVPRLRAGELEVDLSARAAAVGGVPVELRRREFDLLARLAREPRAVIGRAELIRAVWGDGQGASLRTVDSHASRLRLALARAGMSEAVVAVRGIGYRLL